MTLRVLDPGLYTLVVDFGRPRWRSLGVPVGGAADRTSLALGNALVGNPPDAAALEFTLTGPTLRADCELACVVYGSPFQVAGGGRNLTAGKTFTLRPGEVLHIMGTDAGIRGYLCVRGGLHVPAMLGSRSGLGPLRAGDELPCSPGATRARFFRRAFAWERERDEGRKGWPPPLQRVRATAGPQADWFRPGGVFQQQDNWAIPKFRVSAESNRMGLRLKGPPLPVPERELLSEPVCPGSVQVTRDGQCIILGVDGQTIGGYPKIAQVISADLDLVGQLRPGEEVFFGPVSHEEAERISRDKQAELAAWVTRLRAASNSCSPLPVGERGARSPLTPGPSPQRGEGR
jgi:5-oxoprolinase (ATP-hydrolysing) subunit C